MELSCDSQRNISNVDGQYAVETADVAEAILKIKGSGGKFRVTPKRHFVLVRVPSDEEWETLFVTQLAKPLRFDVPTRKTGSSEEAVKWTSTARTGDRYPFAGIPVTEEGLRYKQKSGGVISKQVPGGEVFARSGDKAQEARVGADAVRLVAAIRDLQKVGKKVNQPRSREVRGRSLSGSWATAFHLCLTVTALRALESRTLGMNYHRGNAV